MKILIATPLYPPDIGGPAEYAKNLEQEFRKLGHRVQVIKFSDIKHWPSGLRHLIYFSKILPIMFWADWCLALDTFSVGLPTVLASKLFRKKIIIRTGGDFLWEQYVERTGKLILLRNFYQTELDFFSNKEKFIFKLTKWILGHTTTIIFSTDWQRQIWLKPYSLNLTKTAIIENYYGSKEMSDEPKHKVFISGTRSLKWKNKKRLHQTFSAAKVEDPALILDDENAPYEQFIKKIKECYAVALISLGDISPNLILDALRFSKPFILTKENGLNNRLGNLAVLVDPEDEKDVEAKILWLSNANNYRQAIEKIKQFNFTRLWSEIAEEFVALAQKI